MLRTSIYYEREARGGFVMSLIEIGRQFDDAALALLRSCIGRELVAYEGYCLDGESDHIYKTARLVFDGFAVDLVNEHETLALGPDFVEEEVVILRAEPAKGELWTPPDKHVTRVECGFQVADVLVVVDTALLSKGSRRLIDFKWVQAVIIESEDGGLLAFDRDIWSDEYLTVNRGESVSTTTRDFRADWVAEPPYGYEFGRNILRLTNPAV